MGPAGKITQPDGFDAIRKKYETLFAKRTAIEKMMRHAMEEAGSGEEGVARVPSYRLPRRSRDLMMAGIRVPEKEPDTQLTSKGKLLVMDDEEVIRTILCVMLFAFGYETHLAADGNDAIAQYATAKESGKPFDAVIIDLNVSSGMGGKETLERLIAMDPGVQAIVSSGSHRDPAVSHFRDYGFKAALRKPYTINELRQVLSGVVCDGREAAVS